jgi:hypothetical protein
MADDTVPVPEKRNSADSLENFAKAIEERFRLGKDQGPFAMQRQVCRLLASKNPTVAAAMTAKWVEWRFGRAKETHEHKHNVEVTIGDADRIIAGYFGFAASRPDQAGAGNTSQAALQDSELLS